MSSARLGDIAASVVMRAVANARNRAWFLLAGTLASFLIPVVQAETPQCSVAVDVGHFRAQPGAMSARGVPEFEFNLALARELRSALQRRGCEVMMIGEDGDVISLRERTALAKGAGLFLSVHHDSVKSQYLNEWNVDGLVRYYTDEFAGFSLFVSRDNPDVQRSLACASWIGAELRSAGYAPSLYHADPIRGEDRPFADKRNGVHYYDQLVVLGTAAQGAVLLEAGVIVNRDQELLLMLPQTRESIAQAVASGVRACLPE